MQDKLKKLERLQELADKGNVAIIKYLFDIEDKLDKAIPELTEVINRMKGDKGDSPTQDELLALIEPLIPVVEDGHTPTRDELLAIIKPLIPQVQDGHTPTKLELLNLIKPLIPQIDEDKIVKRAVKIVEANITLPSVDELLDNVEKRLPSLSEPIRDALELLKDEDRLDAKHINGLDTYYNDTFKTFARKEDVHVISTNKPLSEMVDVNVQGLKVNDILKWNGREWIPTTQGGSGSSTWETITGDQSTVNVGGFNNDAGFITEESDTLQSVTDRGAETTNPITAQEVVKTANTSITYNPNGTVNVITTDAGTKTMQYTGGVLTGIIGTGVYKSKEFIYTGGILTAINIL